MTRKQLNTIIIGLIILIIFIAPAILPKKTDMNVVMLIQFGVVIAAAVVYSRLKK